MVSFLRGHSCLVTSLVPGSDCRTCLGTHFRVNREWREFSNSARTDGLKLGHWVKASTDPAAGELLLRAVFLHAFGILSLSLQNILLRDTTSL